MYSAKEAAEITGLSTATLRYYEKEKLIPEIARTSKEYRQYTESDIEWIKMIQCLRMANVPIRSIKKYVSLLMDGGETIDKRCEMVQEYITDMENQICHLQKALVLAQDKKKFYEEVKKDPSKKELTYLEEWELYKNGGKKKE